MRDYIEALLAGLEEEEPSEEVAELETGPAVIRLEEREWEQPGSGADSRDLARRITEKNPHCGVYYAENADEAYDLVKLFAPEYDVVLMLGAGDIYDMKERFAPLTRCPEG